MTNQTMDKVVEEFDAMTVAELRKVAPNYSVSARGLKKAELVEALVDMVWAEYENGHSDEGHDEAPDADCPVCAEEGLLNDKPKATKQQATRHGGRTLIPGYTMNEAMDIASSSLAESISDLAAKAEGVDVLETVESLLMDAADDKKADGPTAGYGRVLNEYLQQNRPARYEDMLTKLHQKVGRTLEARGFSRKNGLPKEGQA